MSKFYCQLDYEHVLYLSPVGAANGNIANNGCGVCSASMLAENMLGVSFPPEEAARFAKMVGARETWGTNLYVFSPAFAAHMGMTVRDTEDAAEALRFLQEKRGMVIANTQGDRRDDGYIGVFSNGGHYIVIAEAEGTTVKVWDPMYKEGSGRFDIPGRKGKVRLDGTDAYADMSVLAQDCKDRPFFLFEKRVVPAPAPMIGVVGGEDGAKAVMNAGGIPMMFSPDMPKEMLRDCLSRLNGLLITGETWNFPAAEAIRICRQMNKPILCTGCGAATLIAALHPEAEISAGAETASVAAVRGTRFEVVSGGEYPVNTCAGVRLEKIPEDMRVCAVASGDETVAAECREGALCLGVNWRPERDFASDANSAALFRALVESARV